MRIDWGVKEKRSTRSALCDRDRCLRYRAPKLRIMAEKDASPALFQRLQPVKRGQHRLAIVHVLRQASFAKGLTEVAGIGGEHDLTVIEPQPKGLVPRRVAIRRQTHHRAIPEHVVLAIHQSHFMAEVEIARVEDTPRCGVGVHSGIPFPALHEHYRLWDQCVAADVIEMEMRVDDEVDLARISVHRFEPGADFLAGLKAERNSPASREPSRPAGSDWQSGCSPVSNSASPFGCSIRKTGIGT